MKVYIASSFQNKVLIKSLELYMKLVINEVEIVSDWYNDIKIGTLKERAQLDYSGIDEADLVLAIHKFGYGTSSEMGYALGSNTPLIYLVDEIFFPGMDSTGESIDEILPSGLLELYNGENDIKNIHGLIVHNIKDLLKVLKLYLKE